MSPQDLEVGDVNRDGAPDLALVDYEYVVHGTTIFVNRSGRSSVTASVPDAAVGPELRLRADPARPPVDLSFGLPAASEVSLTVHDVTGRVVSEVWNGPLPRGEHSFHWDGLLPAGRPAPMGVYFCRLHVGGATTSRKLILAR
jgi:hypothetical protein